MAGDVRIEVQRQSANDDEVLLVEWTVADGARVAAGDVVCLLESSKAVFDCVAPADGYVRRLRQAGEMIPVGEALGAVRAQPDAAPAPAPRAGKSAPAQGADEPLFTAKAEALLAAHGLTRADYPGGGLVRETHVQAWLATRSAGDAGPAPTGGPRVTPLTPVQMRAARVVARAKQTIPHSYLYRHVDAAAVQAKVKAIAAAHDIILSVTDWLIACVARALRAHPRVNAGWAENGLVFHDEINIGFAYDLSDGSLVVPVIRNVDRLDPTGVAGAARALQKRAIRGALTAADFADGHCTVTSMIGAGVHQVAPIVYPGQTAIVGVGDPWGLGAATLYTVSVAFDHRVVSGAQAGRFLAQLCCELVEGTEGDDHAG